MILGELVWGWGRCKYFLQWCQLRIWTWLKSSLGRLKVSDSMEKLRTWRKNRGNARNATSIWLRLVPTKAKICASTSLSKKIQGYQIQWWESTKGTFSYFRYIHSLIRDVLNFLIINIHDSILMTYLWTKHPIYIYLEHIYIWYRIFWIYRALAPNAIPI